VIQRNRMKGFSLTELVTVMAIVAIITAFAYPSYQDYMLRSRRSDAYASLYDLAQRFERCMTEFNAYDDAGCTADDNLPVVSQNGYYQIDTAAIDASSFTLTATPQGVQAKDTDCGALSLTNTGEKTAVGSGTKCW